MLNNKKSATALIGEIAIPVVTGSLTAVGQFVAPYLCKKGIDAHERKKAAKAQQAAAEQQFCIPAATATEKKIPLIEGTEIEIW